MRGMSVTRSRPCRCRKVRTLAVSILVAGQERAFADVLAAWLDHEDDIEVTGAVQVQAPSWSLAGKSAEVMLPDADLPGDATNRLCEEFSGGGKATGVIMLSFSSEPERIVKALRARAFAWVRKDESLEYLLRVIRGVARGEGWLPPGETADVVRLLIWGHDQHRKTSSCSTSSRSASVPCSLAWRKAPRTVTPWRNSCTFPCIPSAPTRGISWPSLAPTRCWKRLSSAGTRQARFARTAAHHPDGRLGWIRRTGDYRTLM
jgi:DNA-binding NarL/FixJ family response regulator